jgi:hypothetical protein
VKEFLVDHVRLQLASGTAFEIGKGPRPRLGGTPNAIKATVIQETPVKRNEKPPPVMRSEAEAWNSLPQDTLLLETTSLGIRGHDLGIYVYINEHKHGYVELAVRNAMLLSDEATRLNALSKIVCTQGVLGLACSGAQASYHNTGDSLGLDGWVALLQGALLLKNMAWEEVRKVTDMALPNNRTRLVTFLRADLVLRDVSIFNDDWNTTVRGVAEWLSTRSPGLFASSYKASREECCPLELRWSYVHSVINHLPDSLRFAVFKSHDFPLHSRTVQLFAYGGGSAPIADLLSSDISKVVDSCAKIGVIEGHTFCIGGPQSCSEGDVRTAVAKFVLRWYVKRRRSSLVAD